MPFKTKPELINKERMDIGRQLTVSAAGVMCLEMAIEVRSVIDITRGGVGSIQSKKRICEGTERNFSVEETGRGIGILKGNQERGASGRRWSLEGVDQWYTGWERGKGRVYIAHMLVSEVQ